MSWTVACSPLEPTIKGTRLELGDNARVAALSTLGICSDLFSKFADLPFGVWGVLRCKEYWLDLEFSVHAMISSYLFNSNGDDPFFWKSKTPLKGLFWYSSTKFKLVTVKSELSRLLPNISALRTTSGFILYSLVPLDNGKPFLTMLGSV